MFVQLMFVLCVVGFVYVIWTCKFVLGCNFVWYLSFYFVSEWLHIEASPSFSSVCFYVIRPPHTTMSPSPLSFFC
ncbi:hypothetical protein HanHA300_Chr02g0040221 [Helianthus annuus]|nr:hypothetical protein HanHA300_Chr02g0040221 [Helianthus annuus]KAJ0613784.1 hypothetical protein HanIR_Chr02g0055221 [Helianthus annuus]KAJ0617574.1 hypothetical protein HanHA89_Chr02g0043331 [Helianthus annuus]KAJ0776109.1 hypothetical protein HanLR1_Chr02g0041851 [Helianthus annuus]